MHGIKYFSTRKRLKVLNMRYGYEVPGMILFRAYLYTYSLLRGVNFKVLPMNGYVLCPVMLPMFKTFLGTPVVE
jgi:hypothetical protein